MSVLDELLKWSEGSSRPIWQQDALRRLVISGKLEKEDFSELVGLCKKEFLLPCPPEFAVLKGNPLASTHLPQTGATSSAVSLISISGIQNINALAPDQDVQFAPSGLTAIYGDNGSGKSGYGRLLKQVCRARGRGKTEKLLPDVRKHELGNVDQAAIFRFRSNDADQEWTWTGNDEVVDALGRIGVFDRHCGSVYVEDKNAVAFRPLGLDLFDHLVRACEEIASRLDGEAKDVQKQCRSFDDLKDGTTKVSEAIEALNSKSDAGVLRKLGTLSEGELSRRDELRVDVAAAKADSPTARITKLKPRILRVRTVLDHTLLLTERLSDEALVSLQELGTKKEAAAAAAKVAAEKGFDDCPLDSVGSETWKALWEAARKYSKVVYPEEAFPHTGEGALCLLCGRPVDASVCKRLQSFEDFIKDETAKAAKRAASAWSEAADVIKKLIPIQANWEETLGELKVDEEAVAESVRKFVASASLRKEAIEKALETGIWETIPKLEDSVEKALRALGKSKNEQLAHLREEEKKGPSKAAEKELAELEARSLLAKRLDEVIAEFERQKKIAALDLCKKKGTKTNSISSKSSQLTKSYVTQGMQVSFSEEIKKLGLSQCKVVLNDAGSTKGKSYHRVELESLADKSVGIGDVLSEGEHRAIGLASFFAEIGSSPCLSGIIFDDPVSSLDHRRRRLVARRLCEESKKRQVLVFTHDIGFLLMLTEWSKSLSLDPRCISLERGPSGTGLCSEELPWDALGASKRVSTINRMLDESIRIRREQGDKVYAERVGLIYGKLREAWERAVEQVFLNDSVQRFRRSVQTQSLRDVYIEDGDYEELDNGMAKCSTWLFGHDDAAPISEAAPEPDEIRGDIQLLRDWIEKLTKRRDAARKVRKKAGKK